MRENLSVGQNIWGWTGNIFPQPQTQTRLAEVRLPLKAREFVQFRRVPLEGGEGRAACPNKQERVGVMWRGIGSKLHQMLKSQLIRVLFAITNVRPSSASKPRQVFHFVRRRHFG